ncbi:MAG: acylphosphatase [Pseudomonadota bacterium]
MTQIARRAVIRGRVQGVSFRAWTVDAARRLGLEGWVRNNPDGAVELLAQGEGDRVAALLEACRQGPPAARVTGIKAEAVAPPARLPDGAPLSGFRQV